MRWAPFIIAALAAGLTVGLRSSAHAQGNSSSSSLWWEAAQWNFEKYTCEQTFESPADIIEGFKKNGASVTYQILGWDSAGSASMVAIAASFGKKLFGPDVFIRGSSLCETLAKKANQELEQKNLLAEQKRRQKAKKLENLGLGPIRDSEGNNAPPANRGVPRNNDAVVFSATESRAIDAHVRRCLTHDYGAKDEGKFHVILDVLADHLGTARIAKVASPDRMRINSDPVLHAFAERVVAAVLDPRCATLPLPPSMLGAPRNLVLLLHFTP